jgi:hypothetical protein
VLHGSSGPHGSGFASNLKTLKDFPALDAATNLERGASGGQFGLKLCVYAHISGSNAQDAPQRRGGRAREASSCTDRLLRALISSSASLAEPNFSLFSMGSVLMKPTPSVHVARAAASNAAVSKFLDQRTQGRSS